MVTRRMVTCTNVPLSNVNKQFLGMMSPRFVERRDEAKMLRHFMKQECHVDITNKQLKQSLPASGTHTRKPSMELPGERKLPTLELNSKRKRLFQRRLQYAKAEGNVLESLNVDKTESPLLARYMRRHMEVGSNMNEIYDINFYKRSDDSYKYLKYLIEPNRVRDLSLIQWKEFRSYLLYLAKMTPSEFGVYMHSVNASGSNEVDINLLCTNLLKRVPKQIINEELYEMLLNLSNNNTKDKALSNPIWNLNLVREALLNFNDTENQKRVLMSFVNELLLKNDDDLRKYLTSLIELKVLDKNSGKALIKFVKCKVQCVSSNQIKRLNKAIQDTMDLFTGIDITQPAFIDALKYSLKRSKKKPSDRPQLVDKFLEELLQLPEAQRSDYLQNLIEKKQLSDDGLNQLHDHLLHTDKQFAESDVKSLAHTFKKRHNAAVRNMISMKRLSKLRKALANRHFLGAETPKSDLKVIADFLKEMLKLEPQQLMDYVDFLNNSYYLDAADVAELIDFMNDKKLGFNKEDIARLSNILKLKKFSYNPQKKFEMWRVNSVSKDKRPSSKTEPVTEKLPASSSSITNLSKLEKIISDMEKQLNRKFPPELVSVLKSIVLKEDLSDDGHFVLMEYLRRLSQEDVKQLWRMLLALQPFYKVSEMQLRNLLSYALQKGNKIDEHLAIALSEYVQNKSKYGPDDYANDMNILLTEGNVFTFKDDIEATNLLANEKEPFPDIDVEELTYLLKLYSSGALKKEEHIIKLKNLINRLNSADPNKLDEFHNVLITRFQVQPKNLTTLFYLLKNPQSLDFTKEQDATIGST